MVDRISRERRSNNMRRIRSSDTKPEMTVRQMIHGMGYRYRLHRRDLPGSPDLVFGPRRAVIFVHGCFWHQHDKAECLDGRLPKSNSSYWTAKLSRNVDRDALVQEQLVQEGWRFLIIWECELTSKCSVRERISSFLDAASGA